MNDIDLTTWLSPGYPGYDSGAFWLPIGGFAKKFFGKFDGNNHKIIGLKINRPGTDTIGLFGCIGAHAVLQNIGVVIKNGDTVKGRNLVGSLAGEIDTAIVNNSFATGAISGGWYVGVIVGENYRGTVSKCYASGDAHGGISIGGIVGDNYRGTVNNCYAMGTTRGGSHVGGLVGLNDEGTVNSCYATGASKGGNPVGGLVGWNHSGTVISSYWDKQTTGIDTSGGSDSSFGKTSMEMNTKSTFVGWDFDSTWGIAGSKNNGYPYLKWQFQTDLINACSHNVKSHNKIFLCYKTESILFSSPLPANTMFSLIDLNGRVIYRTNISGASVKLPHLLGRRIVLWRMEHSNPSMSGRLLIK